MAIESPPKPSLFNLANQLTAARLLISVLLFVLIEFQQWEACLVVFIIGAITDWLDGYVARKLNLSSSFGRMFDPLVDKVMVCGVFVLLLDDLNRPDFSVGYLAPWMVVLVIGREFIVTGIRGLMEQLGIAFGADQLGKIKMVLQCAVLIAAFVILSLEKWQQITLAPTNTDQWGSLIITVGFRAMIYAMVIATALSGIQYLWRAYVAMKNEEKGSGTFNAQHPPGRSG